MEFLEALARACDLASISTQVSQEAAYEEVNRIKMEDPRKLPLT